MNNKKNKSKKKITVFLLLLFVTIGLVGYGVYSYYWAQGNYYGDDEISVSAFNPETIINDNSNFLGEGGIITLTCPSEVSSDTTVTCTGSLQVKNSSLTNVQIDVLDANSGTYEVSDEMTLSPGAPDFNWTTTELNPGSTATLNVSVPTSVSSYYGDSSAHEFTSSEAFNSCASEECYYKTNGAVTVSFKLKATQVHN